MKKVKPYKEDKEEDDDATTMHDDDSRVDQDECPAELPDEEDEDAATGPQQDDVSAWIYSDELFSVAEELGLMMSPSVNDDDPLMYCDQNVCVQV